MKLECPKCQSSMITRVYMINKILYYFKNQIIESKQIKSPRQEDYLCNNCKYLWKEKIS